jgi:hypothetical protein
MTEHDARNRIVVSWLREDGHENAERVLVSTLDEIDHTPQRRSWWPAWRFSDMNTFAKVLVATVAVASVAFVGINLLPTSGSGPGAQPTPSPSSSPTVAPSETPQPSPAFIPNSGPIAAGTYRVRNTPFQITMPSGWDANEGMDIRKNRDGPGELAFGFYRPDIRVYEDACANDVIPPLTGPSIDDLLTTLRAQQNSDVTEPVDATVGNVAAQRIEVSVPDGLDVSSCFETSLRIWTGTGGGNYFAFAFDPNGYQPHPVYLVQAPSGRAAFDYGHATGATGADVAELDAIVNSLTLAE